MRTIQPTAGAGSGLSTTLALSARCTRSQATRLVAALLHTQGDRLELRGGPEGRRE